MKGWSYFINIRPLKLQKDQSLSVTCNWAASLKQICLFICLDMELFFLTLPWKVQLCQFVSDENRTVEKQDLFVKTVLQRSHILFFSVVMIFASLFDCLFFKLYFFVRWMFVKMYICFLSYRTCFRNNKLFLYVFYMEKNPSNREKY